MRLPHCATVQARLHLATHFSLGERMYNSVVQHIAQNVESQDTRAQVHHSALGRKGSVWLHCQNSRLYIKMKVEHTLCQSRTAMMKIEWVFKMSSPLGLERAWELKNDENPFHVYRGRSPLSLEEHILQNGHGETSPTSLKAHGIWRSFSSLCGTSREIWCCNFPHVGWCEERNEH